MSYEQDQNARMQDTTEAMIRMRHLTAQLEPRARRPSERLSAEQIERAAEVLHDHECQHLEHIVSWKHLNEKIKQHFRGKVRVVVDSIEVAE